MLVEIILGLLVLTEGYVIWNLFRKTELLETWVEIFTRRIQRIQDDLKEIDSTGHFEADDEVGSIFEQIKETVNELDNLKGEEIDANK
jgi:DNA primase large subunit